MQIILDIPDYTPKDGFVFQWEDNFTIEVKKENDYVELNANREGLISLARQLLYLAQESFPVGYNLHYDDYNSLEEKSCELIITKI